MRYARQHFSAFLFDNVRATSGVLRVTLNLPGELLSVGLASSVVRGFQIFLNLNCVQSNACVLILGGQCDYQIDAKFWKIISNQHGVNLPRGSTGCLDGRLDREAPPGGSTGASMESLRHGGGAVQRRPELPSGRREHRRVHTVGQRSFVQHLFPDFFLTTLTYGNPTISCRSGEWSQEVHSVPCPVQLRSEQTGRHLHSLPLAFISPTRARQL